MAKITCGETLNKETENTDNIFDCSFEAINVDNTTNSNLSYQRCLSESMSPENSASTPKSHSVKKRMRKNISSVSIGIINTLRYKVLVVVMVCCIINCCLIPIIVYNIYQVGDGDETDTGCLNNSNLSLSDSICMDQIWHTVNLSLSWHNYSKRLEKLFCNALMEHNNESYVKFLICQQIRQENCIAKLEGPEWSFNCTEYDSLNCGDQFDLANNGSICLPLCRKFSQYSETYTTPHVILLAASLFIGIIGGIIVIIISFRKRKKM